MLKWKESSRRSHIECVRSTWASSTQRHVKLFDWNDFCHHDDVSAATTPDRGYFLNAVDINTWMIVCWSVKRKHVAGPMLFQVVSFPCSLLYSRVRLRSDNDSIIVRLIQEKRTAVADMVVYETTSTLSQSSFCDTEGARRSVTEQFRGMRLSKEKMYQLRPLPMRVMCS